MRKTAKHCGARETLRVRTVAAFLYADFIVFRNFGLSRTAQYPRRS